VVSRRTWRIVIEGSVSTQSACVFRPAEQLVVCFKYRK
jgi:hypothetical protein